MTGAVRHLRMPGLLCAAILCLQGCAQPEQSELPPAPPKVVLIGIDGATWSVIDPLLAQGRLPVLQRLMESGAHGVLESDPPMASPAIWTTIATGRRREAHGIRDFLVRTGPRRDDVRLVNAGDRRVGALWNWMGPLDHTTGFTGWWATWPAESVHGWIVSDRFTRSRWAEWVPADRSHGLTFPEGLAPELESLIVDPDDPPLDEIRSLVELTDDEVSEMLNVARPIFAHGMSVFKFAYCAQRTQERIALRLLEEGQPDLLGVFLIAVDPVSHTFWHYHDPSGFEGVDPSDAKRLGALVPAMYEHNDRYLGELLSRLDRSTTILIVSDHGFQGSGKIPEFMPPERYARMWRDAKRAGSVAVGQSGIHHIDGVLVASGPGIRAGTELRGSVFDVAPTVLALLGLPVPEDLDGRVLDEMLAPEFLSAHPLRSIPTLEGLSPAEADDTPADVGGQELMERLRSLGYVQ